MPSDEEKEGEGREPAESEGQYSSSSMPLSGDENEAAGPELTDLGSAAQPAPGGGSEGQYSSSSVPLSGGGSGEQETDGEEPEEEETPAEKKEKKFWLLALGIMLLLLAGGGFFAVTGMRQAAHKLGGGQDYDQLSANSSIYDGRAGAARAAADPFPLDEEAAVARTAGGPRGDRVNPSLVRNREELEAEASGKRAAQGAAANWEEDPDPADPRAAAQAGQAAMAEKLQARAGLSGGFAGSRGSKNSPAAAAGAAGAFQGSGTVIGKATEQRETKSSTPKGAARGSAVEGLKSAFRANFYGARLASHDSARGWIARAFDGTQEASIAIEYDEKMRAKLDRVNPNSIPGFLREQDVSAAEAKTLSVSKVAKAKLDKEGTREALAEDKDYQKKKLAGELSGGTLNGLFGPPGTDPPKPEDPPNDENPPEEEDGPSGRNFIDPDDKADLDSLGLNEYVDSHGFGEECGCSEAAPCCCLPQNTASQGCPLYGPFLPNDPCGAAIYGGTTGAVTAGQ